MFSWSTSPKMCYFNSNLENSLEDAQTIMLDIPYFYYLAKIVGGVLIFELQPVFLRKPLRSLNVANDIKKKKKKGRKIGRS